MWLLSLPSNVNPGLINPLPPPPHTRRSRRFSIIFVLSLYWHYSFNITILLIFFQITTRPPFGSNVGALGPTKILSKASGVSKKWPGRSCFVKAVWAYQNIRHITWHYHLKHLSISWNSHCAWHIGNLLFFRFIRVGRPLSTITIHSWKKLQQFDGVQEQTSVNMHESQLKTHKEWLARFISAAHRQVYRVTQPFPTWRDVTL